MQFTCSSLGGVNLSVGPGDQDAFSSPEEEAKSKAAFSQLTILAGGRETTRFGILVLIIATLLLWIPYVHYAGLAIEFIGLLFIYRGSRAFGERHSHNLKLSIFLLVSSIAIEVLANFFYSFILIGLQHSFHPSYSLALYDIDMDYLLSCFFASILTGLSIIYAVNELENDNGKKLLWTAFGIQLITNGAIAYYLWTGVIYAIESAVAGPFFPGQSRLFPLLSNIGKEELLDVVDVIYLSIYAYALLASIQKLLPPTSP